MSLCIASAGAVLALAVTEFTLSWTHSAQQILWHETWQVSDQGLRPVLAQVQGSGAGIEIPDGAQLIDGAWHYRPNVPPQKRVLLAASGMTQSAWHLCTAQTCHTLGATPTEPIAIWSAATCAAPPPV